MYTNLQEDGMEIAWVDGFVIKVDAGCKEITIQANKGGLISLANQLLELAKSCPGSHIYYDENNSLKDGSPGMIIAKIP